MKIAITGSTGMVGQTLIPELVSQNHSVTPIVRNSSRGDGLKWDPEKGQIDAAALEGHDAFIHLAGENIASRRWNEKQKARIRDSRVQGTTLLCNALAKMSRKPRVLVSASAIGYYGDRGDSICDETSSPGEGFLAEVCEAWEKSTRPAVEAGIRVVNLRIGLVLSRKGGALQKMYVPFWMGVGGVVGNGRQYWSWIALDELVSVMGHCLNSEMLNGPVNAVTPNPVTNREFTKTLGRVMHRPTIFPMPAFAARAAFGEMADALMLSSTRVAPNWLLQSGFNFQYPELETAFRHVLG